MNSLNKGKPRPPVRARITSKGFGCLRLCLLGSLITLCSTAQTAEEPTQPILPDILGEIGLEGEAPDKTNQPAVSSDGGKNDASNSVKKGDLHPKTKPFPYRIGYGDVLQVGVWREPEVSVDGVAVRLDGKISLPLIKEVYVVGLTPLGLEERLTKMFSRFINAPQVSVVPREIVSQKVYVIGGVANPGALLLHAPITILQALAEVGGLTEYAKRNKIYVMRTEGDEQVKLNFAYDAVIKGKQPDQNIALLPGDTLVVPQ